MLPEPVLPELTDTYGIVVTGIGGTGVITIAALLGMAAHLEGKGVVALDMLGLAQKGGAVVSHLKLAPEPDRIGSPRVAAGGAALLLGCDLVVAAGRTALPTVAKGVTRMVANIEEAMTGRLHRNPDLAFPGQRLRRALVARRARARSTSWTRPGSPRLLGDAIAANLFLVGFAWQRGLIPLSREAIERAIELNGVAVAFNARPSSGAAAPRTTWPRSRRWSAPASPSGRGPTLDELIEHRAALLAGLSGRGLCGTLPARGRAGARGRAAGAGPDGSPRPPRAGSSS